MDEQKPPLAADTLDGVVRHWDMHPEKHYTSEMSSWGWAKVWSGDSHYNSRHGIEVVAPSPEEAHALAARIMDLLRVHGFEPPNKEGQHRE